MESTPRDSYQQKRKRLNHDTSKPTVKKPHSLQRATRKNGASSIRKSPKLPADMSRAMTKLYTSLSYKSHWSQVLPRSWKFLSNISFLGLPDDCFISGKTDVGLPIIKNETESDGPKSAAVPVLKFNMEALNGRPDTLTIMSDAECLDSGAIIEGGWLFHDLIMSLRDASRLRRGNHSSSPSTASPGALETSTPNEDTTATLLDWSVSQDASGGEEEAELLASLFGELPDLSVPGFAEDAAAPESICMTGSGQINSKLPYINEDEHRNIDYPLSSPFPTDFEELTDDPDKTVCRKNKYSAGQRVESAIDKFFNWMSRIAGQGM